MGENEGTKLGLDDAIVLGNTDGEFVAPDTLGLDVAGALLGAAVDGALGQSVGLLVGYILGADDGDKVGCSEGVDVGTLTPV